MLRDSLRPSEICLRRALWSSIKPRIWRPLRLAHIRWPGTSRDGAPETLSPELLLTDLLSTSEWAWRFASEWRKRPSRPGDLPPSSTNKCPNQHWWDLADISVWLYMTSEIIRMCMALLCVYLERIASSWCWWFQSDRDLWAAAPPVSAVKPCWSGCSSLAAASGVWSQREAPPGPQSQRKRQDQGPGLCHLILEKNIHKVNILLFSRYF